MTALFVVAGALLIFAGTILAGLSEGESAAVAFATGVAMWILGYILALTPAVVVFS